MSVEEVDSYLASVPEPQRSTLEMLRASILRLVPDAEQCISYQVPAFRVDGSVVAGFAAFKTHLSYLPFSGSVLSSVKHLIKGRTHTKSALHFTPSAPLTDELVGAMISARLQEIATRLR